MDTDDENVAFGKKELLRELAQAIDSFHKSHDPIEQISNLMRDLSINQ